MLLRSSAGAGKKEVHPPGAAAVTPRRKRPHKPAVPTPIRGPIPTDVAKAAVHPGAGVATHSHPIPTDAAKAAVHPGAGAVNHSHPSPAVPTLIPRTSAAEEAVHPDAATVVPRTKLRRRVVPFRRTVRAAREAVHPVAAAVTPKTKLRRRVAPFLRTVHAGTAAVHPAVVAASPKPRKRVVPFRRTVRAAKGAVHRGAVASNHSRRHRRSRAVPILNRTTDDVVHHPPDRAGPASTMIAEVHPRRAVLLSALAAVGIHILPR
ncbi:hypothetical protein SAMN05444166_0353 [Singulisphaera sp. GP187]|uniref:hypothetical protein n=1 Tax=Singulisphaera sp. GP187 TaxID=1882752 RepID=UPI00092A3335|nr:hypothetical protein [Singulisphaera sp. GP187]SIN71411.1 hypothetical protein SAMN05444166_0353 [Singulisphaera sp. GP187]